MMEKGICFLELKKRFFFDAQKIPNQLEQKYFFRQTHMATENDTQSTPLLKQKILFIQVFER